MTFCDYYHVSIAFGLIEWGEVLCNKVLLARESPVSDWIAKLVTFHVEHLDPRQKKLQNAKIIDEEDKSRVTLVNPSPKFKVAI